MKNRKAAKSKWNVAKFTVWHGFDLLESRHCLWVKGIFLKKFSLFLFLGHLNAYEYGYPIDQNMWKTLHGNQQHRLSHTILTTLSIWIWSEGKTKEMFFLILPEVNFWEPLVSCPCLIFAISFLLVKTVLA